MKIINKRLFILFVLLVSIFLFSGSTLAQGPDNDGQVVIGGSYHLASGETLGGDLVLFGGQATLEENSTVNGDSLVIGGSLDVSGKITGSITIIGGLVTLKDTAVVNGDINTVGGALKQSDKAVVHGKISQNSGDQFNINPDTIIPNLPNFTTNSPKSWFAGLQPVWDVFGVFFRAIALAILAAVLMLFMYNPTNRVAKSIVDQPGISFGMGLLTIIVTPALLIILVITIILIPLSLIGLLVLALAYLFGWIAVGLELGNRLEVLFKVSWAPAVRAGIGTLLLTLVGSLVGLIPCIGWLLPFLVGIIGLGGVLLSQFGTRFYGQNLPPSRPAYSPATPSTTPPVSYQTHPEVPPYIPPTSTPPAADESSEEQNQ